MLLFNQKKAVLIIHGFGGGPWENESLANYLELSLKYDVYSWTLKNHYLDIISNIKYTEWLDESRDFLNKLSKKYSTIYVVAHSMGGVITSAICSEFPKIKKIVLLAPAYIYGSWNQNSIDFKNFFKKKIKDDSVIYNDFLTKLFKLPLPTILEFQKLVKANKNSPQKISIPTLIMHGDIDELIPLESSQHAYNLININEKYLTIVKNGRHRLLRGKRTDDICKYIDCFLQGGLKWKLNYKEKI